MPEKLTPLAGHGGDPNASRCISRNPSAASVADPATQWLLMTNERQSPGRGKPASCALAPKDNSKPSGEARSLVRSLMQSPVEEAVLFAIFEAVRARLVSAWRKRREVARRETLRANFGVSRRRHLTLETLLQRCLTSYVYFFDLLNT